MVIEAHNRLFRIGFERRSVFSTRDGYLLVDAITRRRWPIEFANAPKLISATPDEMRILAETGLSRLFG